MTMSRTYPLAAIKTRLYDTAERKVFVVILPHLGIAFCRALDIPALSPLMLMG